MSLPEWLNDPARQRRIALIARQIWESQGKRCAKCEQSIEFEQATKSSHSFDIICRDCRETKPSLVIIDDIED